MPATRAEGTRGGRLLALAATCLGLTAQTASCAEPQPVAEITIPAFLDTLGVNAHLNYPGTCYADLAAVTRDLAYLGLVHVRTGASPGALPVGAYADLARQGIRYDLVVGSAARMGQAVGFAQGLERLSPGAVASFEGFNEVNNWPVTYQQQSGEAGARAAQGALYALVHGTPELARVPVIYLTGAPIPADLSGLADMTAMHAYNNGGAQPERWVLSAWRTIPAPAAQKPVMNTEFGNFTLPASWPEGRALWSGPSALGVDQPTQAKIILTEYLGAARLGVARSFAYELCDERPDPAGHDAQNAFGLFTAAHQPKAAATALHNLTAYLRQPPDPPGDLRLAPGGPSPGGNGPFALALRGEDGRLVIAAWNRAPFWTVSGPRSTPLPDTMADLDLSIADAQGHPVSGPVQLGLFDPLHGATGRVVDAQNGHLQVAVPNYPIFLEATLPTN